MPDEWHREQEPHQPQQNWRRIFQGYRMGTCHLLISLLGVGDIRTEPLMRGEAPLPSPPLPLQDSTRPPNHNAARTTPRS